jgi:capsular exopolysaccharide synthesis family protein
VGRLESGAYQVADAAGAIVLAGARPGAPISFAGVELVLPVTAVSELSLEVLPFSQAVEEVQKRLDVGAVEDRGDVVRLTCEGSSPTAARDLCARLSQSYLALRSRLQQAEAEVTAEFLATQVEDVGKQLKAAEDRLERFEDKAMAVALNTQAQAEVGRLVEVRAQREAILAERDALHALMAEVENGSSAPEYWRLASFPTFMKTQNQAVTRMLESLVELQNRRNDLALRRSEENPDLIAVDERIAELETQLRSIAQTYEAGLSAQVDALGRTLSQASSQLQGLPERQLESARLTRQVNILEEMYRFLQTRLNEAEVARAVNLPSVRVVDQATLPYQPAFPRPLLNLSLATVLGLVAGVVLAFYRESSNTRIYEREDVEGALGVPVVGLVGQMSRPGPLAIPGGRPALGSGMVKWRLDRDQEVGWEAFRSLATELRFARAASPEGKPRTLAVTSTSRGEGKTLTVCNLAVAWASTSHRTLLIDADLRGSSVASFFGLPVRGPGLSEVLTGELTVEQAIRQVPRGDGRPLYVLPAGAYPTMPTELLDTDRFQEVLDWAAANFDLVLVDTPPLNVLADTATIASRVDGMLVVVRSGMTDQVALDLTLSRIGRAGGTIQGIVLNGAALPDYYVRYSAISM